MSQPPTDRSWWTTLPGVLTGLAALLTAVTGLLVALLPVLGRPDRAKSDEARGPAAAKVAEAAAATASPTPARTLPAVPGPGGGAQQRAEAPPAAAPSSPPAQAGDPPPLVLGEVLKMPRLTVQVLSVERGRVGGQVTRIALTYRVTASPDGALVFRDDNVRVFAGGVPYAPKRGVGLGGILIARESAAGPLSAVFEVEDDGGDLVLRFTDSNLPHRSEVRRRLPPS